MTCVSTRQLCVHTLTDKRGNLTLCASACGGNGNRWRRTLFFGFFLTRSSIVTEAGESGRGHGRKLGSEQETRRKARMAISVSGVKFPLTSCGLRNGQGSVKQFLFSLFRLNAAYRARLPFAETYVTQHLPLAFANSHAVGRFGCLFKGSCLGEIS